MTTYVDSDRAGCCTTRRSTAGCTITLVGAAFHHYSRMQTTAALSCGEAELYASSSDSAETMEAASPTRLRFQNRAKAYVTMATDSMTGKSTLATMRELCDEAHCVAPPLHPGLGCCRRCPIAQGPRSGQFCGSAHQVPTGRLRHLCELRNLKPSATYYNSSSILIHAT